jgi:F0F1-type ATP synthase assembly protein I
MIQLFGSDAKGSKKGWEHGTMNLAFDKIAKYLAVGFEIPSTILGGVILGYLADSYFGTSPWLTVIFAVLGFVGAVYRLVKYLKYFSQHGNQS